MNIVISSPATRLTLDEYFGLADRADGLNYELVDGELRAMSPASTPHGLIQANLVRLLGNLFIEKNLPFHAIAEAAVIPRLSSRANVRVPDIVVVSGNIHPGQLTADQPIVIIEVLSPTNELETRRNVRDYATIPSVSEIALVRSTRCEAEIFRKSDDGQWPEEAVKAGRGDTLRFSSVDFDCPLEAVYRGIIFAM